jgi:hypothetical protein
MAVGLAAAIGIGAIQCAEIIYSDGSDAGVADKAVVSMWRVHMGCACVGAATFVLALFCLERLARGSMISAMRSTIPWSPLIAITGIATAIHIPLYIVIPLIILLSRWAYRRSMAVR